MGIPLGQGLRACWFVILAVWLAAAGGCAPLSVRQMGLDPRWCRETPLQESPGRTTIVLDIDNTLSHTDYFDLLLRPGREHSRPLAGAADTLRRLSDEFNLVYLTSRPTFLLRDTVTWLERHEFPAAPIYTADRVAELVSQRRYKTRYISRLQKDHPNACIGIGDRSSDARAYRDSGMVSIIVNPDEDSEFHSQDVVLRRWSDVAGFFEANRRFLADPDRIRNAVASGQLAFAVPSELELVRYDEVDDDHGRGKLNRALVKVFPELREEADHQATAATVVRDHARLIEGIQMAAARWPGGRLVGMNLARAGNATVLQVDLIKDRQLLSAIMDAADGRILSARSEPVADEVMDAVSRSEAARVSLEQAVDIAAKRVDGRAYRVQLLMEYNRPTYEVRVLSRKGFWEVDVDAATGTVQEVDREWRLVPLR